MSWFCAWELKNQIISSHQQIIIIEGFLLDQFLSNMILEPIVPQGHRTWRKALKDFLAPCHLVSTWLVKMQKMFTQMEGPVKGKAFSIEVMAVLGIRILKPRHSNLIWHLWACIQMKLGKCQLKHQPISFWCFWGKNLLYYFTAEEKVKWLWKEQAGGWSSYDEFGAIVFCLAGMYNCWRFVTRELSRFAVRDFLDFNCCGGGGGQRDGHLSLVLFGILAEEIVLFHVDGMFNEQWSLAQSAAVRTISFWL